jgi:hypothetical protein
MSSLGAAPRAAVSLSSACAEASRRNGAKSRGPKTPVGKARSAQNALRHGMRALNYIVLPDEDAVEFQTLEATMIEELAPVGALQVVLARRVAVAAWRLVRADRMEVELFEERRWEDAGVGMALIRDGNGTRSFETLLRYRSAAMAEFWRALKTLKALQAEQAAGADLALELPVTQLAAPAPVRAQPSRPAARRAHADPCGPNEPERLMAYVLPEPPIAGPALHEPPASPPRRPEPNEPERAPQAPSTVASRAAARGGAAARPDLPLLERGPPLLGSIGGTLLELGPEQVSKRQRQA